MSGNIGLTKTILFETLVEIFNKIKRTSNTKAKQVTFQKKFEEWRNLESDTNELAGIIRLFLSENERSRRFDMGPVKLASFLAKTFHDNRSEYLKTVSKDSTTASRQLADKIAEDYRSEGDASGILTVFDINDALDFLANGNSMDDPKKREKMEKLVRNCSEDELEWVFNIMLRNVETSLGTNSNKILGWISPDAPNIWDQSHSLQDTLNGKIGILAEEDEHLFKIWTPMLLQKQKRGDWYANIQKYGGPKFFLQVKFDGENILLHKKGNQYRWFTRNNNDFSKEYGDSSMSIGKLASRIHSFFKNDCVSAIFNCELMLWDKKTKQLCRHNDTSGTSDSTVLSFRHVKAEDNQQLTVVIFDMLYLNGNPMFGAPLEQRLELLDLAALRKQSQDTIFIAEYSEGRSKQEIMRFFETAMANNEEGIVVKRADSQYFKGQRSAANGWFKLKPSASKDCDLDMALVAIYPRAARYGKTLYKFAVKENDSERYRMCLSVSYGLSDALREEIRIHCGDLLAEPPCELVTRFGKRPRDIAPTDGGFVDPERWQVVRINSNGVRNGKLVDPVMREWRLDKPVEQIDTVEDFEDYSKKIQDCKLSDDPLSTNQEDSDLKEKRAARLTRKTIQKSNCAPVELKRAKIESALSGIEVAVLQGISERIRKQCEEILKYFDAKVVKSPTSTTQLIVATAPKVTYPKTVQAIKSNRCTVVKSDWLMRCNSEGSIFPWTENEVLHTVEESFRIE